MSEYKVYIEVSSLNQHIYDTAINMNEYFSIRLRDLLKNNWSLADIFLCGMDAVEERIGYNSHPMAKEK